jgi:hypothetical protein
MTRSTPFHFLTVTLLGAASCTAKEPRVVADPSPHGPIAPAPSASTKAVVVSPALSLRSHRWDAAHISLDVLADVAVDEKPWDVGGVLWQSVPLANAGESFELLVRAHDDESLASFARDHSDFTLTKVMGRSVCGRPAQWQRATRGEVHIACVMTTDGNNHPAYIPPTEITAVAFEHRGLQIVLTMRTEAENSAGHREDVERIIASIQCL